MICPNCRASNLPGTVYCAHCNTTLVSSQVAGASPFDGYNPGWLQAGSAPGKVAAPVSAATSNGSSSGLGFSLDELLKATEEVFPNPAPLPAPVPSPAPSNNGATPPTPVQGVAVPMPSFREPPLWAQPATSPPNFNVRPEDLRTSSQPFERPPMASASRESEEAPYGVDRGFYYYTDDLGELVIAPLGSFLRRFWGAVIDNILMGFLIAILYFSIGSFLIGSLVEHSYEQAYQRGQRVNTRQLNDDFFQLAIGLYIMGLVVTFLYYFLLVGLGGQTFGHRFTKIKVIKSGGRAPGVFSSFIRTLYGTVPGLTGFLLSTFLKPAVIGNILALVLYLVVFIGLLWPLFDRGKQGWHDKLANTYVVSTQKE
jgi:uncharacterized RDD family membrane protein YckC